jgi:hypothetical protein
MKKIIGVLICLVLMCIVLGGCEEDTRHQEEKYQEDLMQQATNEIGMPDITEFFEKKMAKEIFEKRDDSKLVCYAYSQNLNGQFIYVGRCYGYGLPYSTQYTNPEKYEYNGATLPQADPNGLYGAEGLTATWLMMINEETGEPYIMYCEPTIVVTENKIPVRLVADWSLTKNY